MPKVNKKKPVSSASKKRRIKTRDNKVKAQMREGKAVSIPTTDAENFQINTMH